MKITLAFTRIQPSEFASLSLAAEPHTVHVTANNAFSNDAADVYQAEIHNLWPSQAKIILNELTPDPVVKEADPELERLLAEEEEIERRHRHQTPGLHHD